MGKRNTINMKEILAEIKKTEGLPENFASEVQLWDEIMKKVAYVMPEKMLPLIQEVHGKTYSEGTDIKPLATEYSVERGDTKALSSIHTDITMLVDERDIYHFECQLKKDGTMILRMFEYDVHIALSYGILEQTNDNMSVSDKCSHRINKSQEKMILEFPHSAVLYLEGSNDIPDSLSCQIRFQDGGTYEYTVPTLQVQSYSLEKIKEKHLSILIPFLPLRFRRKSEKTTKIEKEELTSFYQKIILILEEEVRDGYLTEMHREAILSLLEKSLIRVFYKDEAMLREVVSMTEPILEIEFEKYWKLMAEKDAELERVMKTTAELDKKLGEQTQQVLKKVRQIEMQDKQLEEKSHQIEKQDKQLEEKDKEIENLKRQLQLLKEEK